MDIEQEHQHYLDIDVVDTGALQSTTIPVNQLGKGGYAILERRPCRVVDIVKCKPSKHGHSKGNIYGTDIITGRRDDAHLLASHQIEVPMIDPQDYAVINISDTNMQLLSANPCKGSTWKEPQHY